MQSATLFSVLPQLSVVSVAKKFHVRRSVPRLLTLRQHDAQLRTDIEAESWGFHRELLSTVRNPKLYRAFSVSEKNEDDVPAKVLDQTLLSLLEHAQEDINAGALREASEKLWKAASLAVDNVCREVGIQTASDRIKNNLLVTITKQCGMSEERKTELIISWGLAQNLHRNVFDDDLETLSVTLGAEGVEWLAQELSNIDVRKIDREAFLKSLSESERSDVLVVV